MSDLEFTDFVLTLVVLRLCLLAFEAWKSRGFRQQITTGQTDVKSVLSEVVEAQKAAAAADEVAKQVSKERYDHIKESLSEVKDRLLDVERESTAVKSEIAATRKAGDVPRPVPAVVVRTVD